GVSERGVSVVFGARGSGRGARARARASRDQLSPSQNASMRLRMEASGRAPRAAARLSSRCASFVVPGIAQVTAGCDTTYLRKNWAQRVANSLAHVGTA